MEKVVLDGLEYVKASVLAKEFRYTSDYLGQLCRANKVDSRLVGRTWFINPDSLRTHKKGKYASVRGRKAGGESQDTSESALQRTVKPVLRNKTAKAAFHERLVESGATGTRNLTVAYQSDEESLLPNIERKRSKPAKTLKVEAHNSKRVKIKGTKKSERLQFEAEELPEVSLRGRVTIEAIPEAEEVPAEKKEPKVETDRSAKTHKITVREPHRIVKVQKSDRRDKPKNIAKTKKSRKVKTVTNQPTPTVAMKRISKADLPSSKLAREVVFAPETILESRVKPVSISGWVRVSPLVATLAAIAVSGLIFTLSSSIDVGGGNFSSSLRLQMANLLAIFLP